MRPLALLLFVSLAPMALLAGAAAPSREGQLESLKKTFPLHTSGPVTEKSDPLVRECYSEFEGIVSKMTLESLPKDVGNLRKLVDSRISRYRYQLEKVKGKESEMQTPSMRGAIEQNLAWLTQKVRPYIARLETFQRGRGL